jgi:hypothetical protein
MLSTPTDVASATPKASHAAQASADDWSPFGSNTDKAPVRTAAATPTPTPAPSPAKIQVVKPVDEIEPPAVKGAKPAKPASGAIPAPAAKEAKVAQTQTVKPTKPPAKPTAPVASAKPGTATGTPTQIAPAGLLRNSQ